MKHTLLLMAVMALTTYLIRMLPFVVFRRKITSRFARSFLSYAPPPRGGLWSGSGRRPWTFWSGSRSA